jgi:hypothetical protein
MSDFVKKAVSDRVENEGTSRWRALGAAIVIGCGAAVLAYRLLRGPEGVRPAPSEA